MKRKSHWEICAVTFAAFALSSVVSAQEPSTATFQTGFTYLFSPDLQADVRVARRLTDRGVDFLAGAGISWRLGG